MSELPRLAVRFIPHDVVFTKDREFPFQDCALQYREDRNNFRRFLCSSPPFLERAVMSGGVAGTYWTDAERHGYQLHDCFIGIPTTEEECDHVVMALNACCEAKKGARRRTISDMFASWGDPAKEPDLITARGYHAAQLVVLALRQCLPPEHPAVKSLEPVHARGASVEDVFRALREASVRRGDCLVVKR